MGLSTESHSLKRGTVSTLAALKYKQELINLHVGWAPGSNMLATYRRPVDVGAFDRLFFFDVLRRT